MDKLLVVDGHNLLFQMFFGMPSRIVNQEGRAIQGTLGFVGALLKILRMVSPTHAVVLFDGENGGGRRQLDPAYKANRPDYAEVPEEENPFSQLPDIFRALCCLGIPYTETDGCEADDVAAAYALRFGGEMEVVIASYDSDFFQLVSESVTVLRYRGKETMLCTPAYIRQKFGIFPWQYAALKALVGDRSDNIEGIEKIGVKTAAKLLHQLGPLEEVVRRVEEIEKISVRQSIRREKERLLRNYALIRLTGDVPLPWELEALAFAGTELTTNDVLRKIGLK